MTKKLLKDRAGTGRAILQTEKKGKEERLGDTKDNRRVRKMKLTESGEAMLKLTTKKFIPLVKKIKTDFSPEKGEQLKKLLNELRTILAENVKTQI